MALTNFQVFQQYLYSTLQERITQNIELFNSATRGALILGAGNNLGDYSDMALYARISGLVRRRNVYGSGAVSHTSLSMLLETSVKVAAGTPPVDIDPSWFSWINKSPDEAGVVIGKQLAEDTLSDMVNTSIKSLIAAILNVGATVVYDGTAAVNSLGTLNNGARLFGDKAQEIGVWIVHSQPMFDIFGAALTNANELFTFGTVKVVQDGFGRPFVITDAPDLVYTSSGTKYRTLGLVPGASMVQRNDDFLFNVQTNNGDENIGRTWQAEWTYNMALKGFAWDKTNGGASPTNAALATGTNWDQFATSIKDLPGVLVNSQ